MAGTAWEVLGIAHSVPGHILGVQALPGLRRAALACCVVNSDPDGVDHGLESKPLLASAVCYVTAHLALNLVNEKQAEAILKYCEEHLEEGS
jgi:hypothetical protein